MAAIGEVDSFSLLLKGQTEGNLPASGKPVAGRFERISEDEVVGLRSERPARLDTSIEAFGRSSASSADFDPLVLLRRLLASAMEVVGAQRGLVILTDVGGALHAEVVAGLWPSPTLAERIAACFSDIQTVDRSRRARAFLVAPGSCPNSSLSGPGGVVEIGRGTAAYVPLRAEGRVLGLLYLGGRRGGSALAKFDVEILEALGEHAAIVLASFRLNGRIRRLLQRLHGGVTPEKGALGQSHGVELGRWHGEPRSRGDPRLAG